MHFTTVTANPCVDRTIQVDSVNLGHSHRIQKTICDFSGKGINVSLALTQLGMPVKSVCLSHSDGEAADFFKQREMDAELMYFDSYITGKRIQQLRKTKGLTQEQFAVKLNISDRHLGKIERGEGTASIDLLVEVAISLNTTLDFLILGVLDTPRERELNAQIKKQHQKIQIFKNKLSNLIDELDTSASV